MIEVSERLKQAFMTDNVEKKIRITFPNGEHETIGNNKIQANTFKFTESLCSQDELKFGLCEANVLNVTAECDNIKGCVIKVYIDAYYDDEVFTVPYGVFTVTSCKRQAGTHLRNIEAYSESATENDTTLTPFQDWKLKNSISYTAGTINYGYKKMIAEMIGIQGDWSEDGLTKYGNYTIDTYGDVVVYPRRTTFYRFDGYSVLSGEPKYTKVYYIDIDYYKIAERAIIGYRDYPWSGDFTNAERVYKCEFDDSSEGYEIIRNIAKNYYQYSRNNYFCSNIESKINPKYRQEVYAGDSAYYNEYMLENNKQYYLCHPNVAKYTNQTNYRSAYVIFPKKVKVYTYAAASETGHSSSVTYDLSNTVGSVVKNTIKYTNASEIFPTVAINLDLEITESESGIKHYVPSDESIKGINKYNLLNGWLELQGLFGKVNRYGNWNFFSINDNFALYPQEVLFPNADLYPVIASRNFQPLSTVSYKAADYEEFETHKYGYVRVSYLASDEEKYSITVECDSSNDNVYDMTNNYILMSRVFTPDEIKSLVNTYFYPNVKDITYNPAELTIKGLPFLESGDVIKVKADEGTFKTFLFRKTLSGEQALNEVIEAKGQERTDNADLWISVVNVVEEN